MEKKKIIGTIALGGLMLSAPLAVFAGNGGMNKFSSEDRMSNSFYNNQNFEEKIDFLEASLELQAEHARLLLNQIDLENTDIDIDRLNGIIDEYLELEDSLSQIDNEALAEDLREAFFENKMESRSLTFEFRDLIENAFSIEERDFYRTEFRSEMDNLRENYNLNDARRNFGQSQGRHMRNNFDNLNDEQRNMINSEMGWNNRFN